MKVIDVKHLDQYKLEIKFSDNSIKCIDLKKFLMTAKNPMTTVYRNIELFKKVNITHGNLSWGDSEMDLSAESLFNWKD